MSKEKKPNQPAEVPQPDTHPEMPVTTPDTHPLPERGPEPPPETEPDPPKPAEVPPSPS